jgi:hypothetical protein
MAMRYRAALAAIALAGAGLAHAEEEGWKGDATLQWTMPRAGDEFATGIVAADHGALHLEARANYEAIHAQSAFVGGTFALGDTVKLEATPMAGFVGGSLRGPIAGLEATVSTGPFDWYVEAEHVWDKSDREASYTYAWSQLGYRPGAQHWAHFGLVTQRTRIYGGDREVQHGPFLEVTYGKVTVGGYWFNPGSSQQVVIASVAVSF